MCDRQSSSTRQMFLVQHTQSVGKGAWQYKQPNPENKLQFLDDAGKPIQIPQLAPGDARCTLGVRLAPDSNNKAEFFYLLDVAKSWQTSMAVAKITHAAAELGLQQVILQKLEYPLVVTTFTHQQCRQIMQPILSAGLLAAGIVHTFPRAIIHGPWQWGGSNIPNLFTKQLITHVHTMMKYRGQATDTAYFRQYMKISTLNQGYQGQPTNSRNAYMSTSQILG